MASQIEVTGEAVTQVLTIKIGEDAVSIYPSSVPYIVSQLMAGAVALGLGMDYPAPQEKLTFKKGN